MVLVDKQYVIGATTMNNFIVYAVYLNRTEKVLGTFETRDLAIAAIERFLNRSPKASCYINNETVAWVK